jgi:U3 small nucleolar RNA-associated protein MPP10
VNVSLLDFDFVDLSSHEKRLAALQTQISAFEAENVTKKSWVLMGEASSKSRPLNSLLEEDLEFERIARAAPAISDEVVQELEERIKTRIMEKRFDDVVRIHESPEKAFLPSRLFELKDTKSELSLAQIYEKEYMNTQGGLAPGHEKDEKLKKEHEEIEKLWEGICYKLDALCNAHFVPKQVCHCLFYLP